MHDPSLNSPRNLRNVTERAAALILFAALYLCLRVPTSPLVLPYYDDGETLYHTLSLLEGRIPYRDNYTHHFLGYVLPFFVLAKFIGFSTALIPIAATLTVVLTGFFVFLITRMFANFLVALLAGLLLVSARQPFELSFFIQYEINLFFTVILLLAIQAVRGSSTRALFGAFLIAGFAFVCDQRALALVFIPAVAALLSPTRPRLRLYTGATLSFLTLPLAALAYLYYHGAVTQFIEQTVIFPKQYRIASHGLLDILTQGVWIHRHLMNSVPIHLYGTAIGLIYLLTRLAEKKDPALWLLIAAIVPLTVMPFLGGRDFDYYTITWIPYLSILAALGAKLFRLRKIHWIYCGALALPPIIALAVAYQSKDRFIDSNYSGDGVEEVEQFLVATIKPEETLHIWGYRPDLYARLERLSPYPIAMDLMIQPDITKDQPLDPTQYVYPKYQSEFLSLLKSEPPDWLVVHWRSGEERSETESNTAIQTLTRQHYQLVFQSNREDITGTPCHFEVYRRE